LREASHPRSLHGLILTESVNYRHTPHPTPKTADVDHGEINPDTMAQAGARQSGAGVAAS
jgi:hypothetical protein